MDALAGLEAVKGEVHRQVAVLQIEAKREAAGSRCRPSPATSSSSATRAPARPPSPDWSPASTAPWGCSPRAAVEVDRSELVAGYLGQTAMKTADVVKTAAGGELFIDEAYSLAGDQYGTEAVDTLVKERRTAATTFVVIVAGYPEPMAFFIAQNPGLASRFRTTIEFADYSDDELVGILPVLAEAADYDITDEVGDAVPRDAVRRATRTHLRQRRYARNVLEAAIGQHAWRLRDVENPTVEELRTLMPDDLVYTAVDDTVDEALNGPKEGLSS